MKYFILAFFAFFSLVHIGFAQESNNAETNVQKSNTENIQTVEKDTLQTGEILSTADEYGFLPTLDSETLKNATHTYYYGDGCSHCADLDVFLKKFGGYETLDITKKEIWKNKENQKEFLSEAERLLGKNANKAGTPFWIIKTKDVEIPLIGTDNVENFIKPALGDEPVESYKNALKTQQTNKYITLGLLLLFAIGLPAGLYFIGRKK